MPEQFDADSAGNAGEIEMQFAVKTVEHLEVSNQVFTHHKSLTLPQAYEKILSSIPPNKIKFTP